MQTRKATFGTTALAVCAQFSGSAVYGICSFALSVVLFRETRSLWVFAGNTFAAAAATALMGPLAGILIDRFGRVTVCGLATAAVMLAGILAWPGSSTAANLAAILLFTTLTGIMSSCLAVTAVSLPGLLSSNRPDMGRLLAGIQVADQLARVLAPLALFAFDPLSIAKIIALVIAVAASQFSLLFVFRQDVRSVERATRPLQNSAPARLLHTLRDALNIVRRDRVLRIFAPYLTVSTACVELAAIALTPIFLSFGSEAQLGVSFGLANAAAVLGSIMVARWRLQWTRLAAMRAFLAIEALGGIFIVIEAQTSSVLVYSAALVCGFLILPASLVAAQFVWLSGFPADRQGAYAGLERTASWILVPFAYLLAPFLTSPAGTMRASVGQIDSLRQLATGAGLLLLTASTLAYLALRKRDLTAPNHS